VERNGWDDDDVLAMFSEHVQDDDLHCSLHGLLELGTRARRADLLRELYM
jgi:hypothetical protein